MLARVARAALFFATMFVVSTLARSAFAAAAPFCDDRGATALAAPPDLQAPDDAIQKARAEACGMHGDGDAWVAMFRAARMERSAPPPDPSPARLTAAIVVAVPSSTALHHPEAPGEARTGSSSRVERPPRF
jgi:hypothetical protein